MSLINTQTLRYPMTPHDVFVEVGGGITLPTEFYIPDGYAWVTSIEPPSIDRDTHSIMEMPPTLVGDIWVQAWGVRDLTLEEKQDLLAREKFALMAEITRLRCRKEEGGVTLPNGIRVGSTKDDQNRITSVIANAALAGVESVDFKAATGWVTLSIGEIRFIAGAIARHVQAHFTAERAHHEAIAAIETPEELRAYDIYAGWPE